MFFLIKHEYTRETEKDNTIDDNSEKTKQSYEKKRPRESGDMKKKLH